MLPITSPNPFYPTPWGIEDGQNEVNALIRAMNVEMVALKSDGSVPLGDDALFIISGGPIMVLEFVGLVTTPIGANVATAQIQEDVTTPAGTVNLSTAVAITSDAAGTTYTFTAAAPGVLTPTTPGALVLVPEFKWLLPVGTVVVAMSAANTGEIAWYMVYRKLSPDSVVTVAP
jgi:hypothetical protein